MNGYCLWAEGALFVPIQERCYDPAGDIITEAPALSFLLKTNRKKRKALSSNWKLNLIVIGKMYASKIGKNGLKY